VLPSLRRSYGVNLARVVVFRLLYIPKTWDKDAMTDDAKALGVDTEGEAVMKGECFKNKAQLRCFTTSLEAISDHVLTLVAEVKMLEKMIKVLEFDLKAEMENNLDG